MTQPMCSSYAASAAAAASFYPAPAARVAHPLDKLPLPADREIAHLLKPALPSEISGNYEKDFPNFPENPNNAQIEAFLNFISRKPQLTQFEREKALCVALHIAPLNLDPCNVLISQMVAALIFSGPIHQSVRNWAYQIAKQKGYDVVAFNLQQHAQIKHVEWAVPVAQPIDVAAAAAPPGAAAVASVAAQWIRAARGAAQPPPMAAALPPFQLPPPVLSGGGPLSLFAGMTTGANGSAPAAAAASAVDALTAKLEDMDLS